MLSIIFSIHHIPAVDSATWRVLRDCGIARTITRRGCRAGSSYQRPIRTVMSHGRYSRDFADNIYHLQAEYDFNIKFSGAIISSWNMQIPLTVTPWELQQSNDCSRHVNNNLVLIQTKSKPKTKGHFFPSIFFTNARSMINKLDAIHGTIKANSFSIAAITESWLSSRVTDDLISLPGYVTRRKDRPNDKRSGGICIISHHKQILLS